MMLARLIQFALTQRLLMLVVTALLMGLGILSFRALPIDAFPDVSTTQVKIIIKAPGMTPEEVERWRCWACRGRPCCARSPNMR
jgi:cobalt-zinc-cadmium resistance protein CzcA